MVKLYVKQIKEGKKTISDVPKLYLEKVKNEFKNEYDNKEITTEEYKKYIGE